MAAGAPRAGVFFRPNHRAVKQTSHAVGSVAPFFLPRRQGRKAPRGAPVAPACRNPGRPGDQDAMAPRRPGRISWARPLLKFYEPATPLLKFYEPASTTAQCPEARRPGCRMARRPGDLETRRPGDQETRKPNGQETRTARVPKARRPGCRMARRPGWHSSKTTIISNT